MENLFGKGFVWRISVENLCGGHLRRTSVQNLCGEPLWKTIVENLLREPLWRTSVENFCGERCNLAILQPGKRLRDFKIEKRTVADMKTHGKNRGQRSAKRRAFFYLEDRKTRGEAGATQGNNCATMARLESARFSIFKIEKTHCRKYENAWESLRGKKAAKRRAFSYLQDRKTHGRRYENAVARFYIFSAFSR